MARSRSRLVACAFAALGLGLLSASCQGAMTQMPSGMGGMIQSGVSVGSAVLNRPKFTEADEERMGRENAAKYDKANELLDDPLLNVYLNDIVQRLAAVAHPRPFTYRIKVNKDASINAFTFGAGYLYVNAGLLARMDNEAQLAMVLAHEIAHVTESHVTKGIEGAYGIQLLGEIARVGVSASGAPVPIPAAVLAKTYEYSMKAAISGHGRGNESDADVIGMQYLVKAGYDPREAPKTFQQLQKEYGDQTPLQNFFYGDHPTNQSRIEKLTGLLNSEYRQLDTSKLVANTEAFARRTREIVVQVGRLDYERQRYKEATAMLEKALAVREDDAVAHYFLGKVALDSGAPGGVDRAITHLSRATTIDARLVDPYRELGMAYYRKQDNGRAVTAFERYLTLTPNAKDADQIKKIVKELKRP